MNAKNRFCGCWRHGVRGSKQQRRTIARRSTLDRVTPALSMATSVPVPIAIRRVLERVLGVV